MRKSSSLAQLGPFKLLGFEAAVDYPLSSHLYWVHFGCEVEWHNGHPAYFFGWFCGRTPWIYYSRNISTVS
jgi:hypothetical protein